ncbi:MAG: ATP adenylyltransferase family protein [Nitrospirota bacterium]
MNSRILLKKNTLWKTILETSEKALHRGAQFPIPTEYEFIEDAGVRFFVRIISSLERKSEEKQRQLASGAAGLSVNPFLPYDQALYIADISGSHIALLNKYNVVENHLLIVTRHFEDQEALLTIPDLEALCACMAEYDSLGFYNGGEAAGASQRHKHLQVVPLPLAPKGPGIPVEPLLDEATFNGIIGQVPAFPFRHVFIRLEDVPDNSPSEAAQRMFELYGASLLSLGMRSPDPFSLTTQSSPYCFILTRKWMLLVPRSREYFDSLSINSLGFAGALLVRNGEQMNLLKDYGPMKVLGNVGIPI